FMYFYFQFSAHPSYLHSSPTRRSSDLPPCPGPLRQNPARVSISSRFLPKITHARDARRASRRQESFRVPVFRPAGAEHRHIEWKDRKSTRLNSSHLVISYSVFCLKKKK